MRASVLRAPFDLKVEERPIPVRQEGEALIRIRAIGICRSDVQAYKGLHPYLQFPSIIGHEASGEIVEIGPNDLGLEVGDRVAVDPVTSCGHCRPCRYGRGNCCENIRVLASTVEGCLREYITVPVGSLYAFPESTPFSTMALCEPLSIGAHGVSRGQVKDGDLVAIVGAGPIGLSALMIAKQLGAKVVIMDRIPLRLDRAKEFGADLVVNVDKDDPIKKVKEFTDGIGADVTIEAVGSPETIEMVIEMAAAAGTVATIGLTPEPLGFTFRSAMKKELDIRACRTQNKKYAMLRELILAGKVNLERMITHRFGSLEDVPTCLDLMDNHMDQTIKLVIQLG